MNPRRLEELIATALPDCVVRVTNDAGDGEHFAAEVTSSAFVGLSRVNQHRLVYAALGDHMRGEIHALALRTFLPPNPAASSGDQESPDG